MKLNTWKVKIKLFNWSWIMAFIDTLHIIIILAVQVKVVAFGLAHFQVLFLSLFSFRVYNFVSPLIFLLGLFTLFFIFYYLLFSKYGKTTCRKKGMYIFTRLSNSIQKLWICYYRTLIMAPHGDGISLWDVKNTVD